MQGFMHQATLPDLYPVPELDGNPGTGSGTGHRRRAPLRPGLGAVPAFSSSLPSDITIVPELLSQLISGRPFPVCTGQLAQVPLPSLATSFTRHKNSTGKNAEARGKNVRMLCLS